MVQSPVLQALAINLVNLGYNTDTNIQRAFLYSYCFSQLNLIGQQAASDHVISSFISEVTGTCLCSCISG
jgi:hypothetical protein